MAEPVHIYTSPACPYCKMAKDFLQEKGVAFREFDVTKDKNAMKEMRTISGGARSVPVIQICNEVMVGFDKARVETALNCLSQSTPLSD